MRIVHNDFVSGEEAGTHIMLIRSKGDTHIVKFDSKYLLQVQARIWTYTSATRLVSSAQAKLYATDKNRISLQHFICKLEYPEREFKHVHMQHHQDFRISQMMPKFKNEDIVISPNLNDVG